MEYLTFGDILEVTCRGDVSVDVSVDVKADVKLERVRKT